MAVFTQVNECDLARYLNAYCIGEPIALAPIAEGIENTNYLLETTAGRFILTLFERRTPEDALPYIIGLMRHLETNGVPVPRPIPDTAGQSLKRLNGRPSLIVSFLEGKSVEDPGVDLCRQAGGALAALHSAAGSYGEFRPNPYGLSAWESLAENCQQEAQADDVAQALIPSIMASLDRLDAQWPYHLPKGPCHTDLFPDNVFFKEGRLSGLIDFYFACDEILTYDLAVCLVSWCFDRQNRFVAKRAEAMIAGYGAKRALGHDERAALPILCLGAATRFTLTRLYDRLHPQDGAMVIEKDPEQFAKRMRHFHDMASAGKGIF